LKLALQHKITELPPRC